MKIAPSSNFATPSDFALSSTVFLWGVPRSVSTAFEKACSQHPAITTLHEPFTDSYYFSKGRRSERYGLSAESKPPFAYFPAHDLAPLGETPGLTFIKELAFQGEPYVTEACLAASRHLVILRHPMVVYRSLVPLKPDFTEDEFGFTALERLVNRLDRLNRPPLATIDGDEFRNNPEAVLREALALLGIDFDPAMMHWPCGRIRRWMPDEVQSQAPWHQTLERSVTILPATELSPFTVRPEHRAVLIRAEAIHGRLCAGTQK